MAGKVSVVIEQDEHGCYAWCPELKGCQSEGRTVEEALANIREAIELFLETLSEDERAGALSREILTTAVEVHAEAAPAATSGMCWLQRTLSRTRRCYSRGFAADSEAPLRGPMRRVR